MGLSLDFFFTGCHNCFEPLAVHIARKCIHMSAASITVTSELALLGYMVIARQLLKSKSYKRDIWIKYRFDYFPLKEH